MRNIRLTHRTLQLALSLAAATLLASCDKNDKSEVAPDVKEYRYVRVLVTDEQDLKLTQITPRDASITSFDTDFPLGTLYPTASGRFAGVLYGPQNLVKMFDTGLESHGDHIDVKGTPKWGAITSTAPRPAHFKSSGAETLIFNDGDGTLSVSNETNFHNSGARFTVVNAGLVPHHGAMAHFGNDTYAVTTASASGASPTRVQVIDKRGALTHASTLQTGAIHGNASDGENAVFGAWTSTANTSAGVLVVNKNGQQRLIPNPTDFGAFRLGTVLYAKEARKFIGFSGAKGAYLINLVDNKITPIYAGNDAFQCKTDYAGKNLLVLTLDGKLRIYDLVTGTLKKEGDVLAATPAADTFKPVLEATEKFAYIAVPTLGEVHQIKLDDFSTVVRHKVTARPVRLTVLGFESDAVH
ncbi:hypothetical protein D0N36_14755 [Hymenobacter lapidiphilus]|uniref:hypothetical protein n=1 Tax=Hymenobacter sp. CCM 8763 TaxID=2303334 RepID=UPI000E3514E9|nr:hypothetical protein [Hymenobacter sp. CCM 8763]RFP64314.1 hypothetical protein D0N36_14755 [Hymenobacter sp. CCM 8763]